MSAFIINECIIVSRDTEPKCVGEIPVVPIYETLSISLHFVGTGDTRNISNNLVLDIIMQRLERIENALVYKAE
jgi:hypothetical protein